MGIKSNGKEILLAVFIGGSVVLSASAAAAECNETQTNYDELVHEWNNVSSALIQTQIEYQAATINFAIEKAGLVAEKERAWDTVHEESEAASECRTKMNEEYGDPGWPVSDPIYVDMTSRYMWTWELACGQYSEETTCATCIKDLNYAQEVADMWMGGCAEFRQEDIQDACEGNCDKARVAKVRCKLARDIASNSADWWQAEATKLQEKYEPDKYKLVLPSEDTDG